MRPEELEPNRTVEDATPSGGDSHFAASPHEPPATDQNDIDDSAEIAYFQTRIENGEKDLQRVHDILAICDSTIREKYVSADDAAREHQRIYRHCSLWSVILGGSAVAIAILQLSNLLEVRFGEFLLWVEFITAATSVAVVLTGKLRRWEERWLLERYKAECLRLLKFGTIFDPQVWSDNSGQIIEALETRVREVDTASSEDFTAFIAEGEPPRIWKGPELSPRLTRELVRYYRRKRLRRQLNYLSESSRREEQWDARTRLWGPILFFGSVAFVLAHFAVDVPRVSQPEISNWSRFFILLAATLPVAGAAVHTYRSGREFGRNALRHRTTFKRLCALDESLVHAETAPEAFCTIGFCEQMLRADHHEWARLMTELEWFG